MINSLKLSLIVVFFSIIINFIFSIIFYFLKDFKNFSWKKIVENFFILPIFLPPSVIGYLILISLSRNSFLGKFFLENFNLKFIFSINGAIVASILVSLPIIYQNIKLAFNNIEKEYIETAQCLGVNTFQMLIYIYIPMTYHKLLSTLILGIGRAFGEFGATILVAGNIPSKTRTLPLALYTAIEGGDFISANKYLLLILIISSFLLGMYQFLMKKKI